jgi:poly(3-hydroxybutyrate) depolymerase
VKFTLEILDELSETFCIDPARVYATGMSNGGGFTALLACDPTATKRIAAFAPVSAAIYLNNKTEQLDPCKPSRDVVPMLEFHGWIDGQIWYNQTHLNSRSNGYSIGIQEWFEGWAERDGFDKNKPEITYLCSEAKNVTRYSWDDTVVHYNVSNYNHNWPRTYKNENTQRTTCEDADATRVILDWFAKWRL